MLASDPLAPRRLDCRNGATRSSTRRGPAPLTHGATGSVLSTSSPAMSSLRQRKTRTLLSGQEKSWSKWVARHRGAPRSVAPPPHSNAGRTKEKRSTFRPNSFRKHANRNSLSGHLIRFKRVFLPPAAVRGLHLIVLSAVDDGQRKFACKALRAESIQRTGRRRESRLMKTV
jgi:hypothetical protein